MCDLIIKSVENTWIKLYKKSVMGKSKYFIVENEKCIKSIITKYKVVKILVREGFKTEFENYTFVSGKIWEKISTLSTANNIVGIFEKPILSVESLKYAEDLIILDRVQDPGNMGTIIRTAVASGWGNLICLKGSVYPFSTKVIRSTAGAICGLNIFTDLIFEDIVQNISIQDFQIVLADGNGDITLKDVSNFLAKKPCLILGNEGHGLKIHNNIPNNTIKLKIDMKNQPIIESLNVSIAAGLIMYKIKNLI